MSASYFSIICKMFFNRRKFIKKKYTIKFNEKDKKKTCIEKSYLKLNTLDNKYVKMYTKICMSKNNFTKFVQILLLEVVTLSIWFPDKIVLYYYITF